MAKNKTTEKTFEAAEGMETVAKNGAEAFKTGFEKAVKGYDQFLGFGKVRRSRATRRLANVAAKGAETPEDSEIFAYSKQSMEDTTSPPRRR